MLMPLLEWELGNLLNFFFLILPHLISWMHFFRICMDCTLFLS